MQFKNPQIGISHFKFSPFHCKRHFFIRESFFFFFLGSMEFYFIFSFLLITFEISLSLSSISIWWVFFKYLKLCLNFHVMDKNFLTFYAFSCFGGGTGWDFHSLKIFMHHALTGCMYLGFLAHLACSARGITSFNVMYVRRQRANFHRTCNH
jgi:hypothetical protein